MGPSKLLWFLFFLLPVVLVFSLCVGAYPLDLHQIGDAIVSRLGFSGRETVDRVAQSVFWFIRLPRVLLSMLVGASLAVSGTVMQALFRNPLADPGLVGVSSGGMLSASLSILLGWNAFNGMLGYYGLSLFTFMGSISAMFLVLYLSKIGGYISVSVLLLAGIAINALAGALTSFLMYLSDDSQLRSIVFWTLGSFGGANWKMLAVFLLLGCTPLFYFFKIPKQLDAYSLGDSNAFSLGVNVRRLRWLLLFLVTLSVAAGVAFVGIVGFVGLVVPHAARLLLGNSHRRVVVGAALLGALLLPFADLVCRTMVAPAELPIGILTAAMGAPLFISLLIRRKKEGANGV